MLNFLQGHSRKGVASFSFYLFFFVIFPFQSYLKLLNLSFHGIWRDEVATLYFSAFPASAFSGDSHSFFYYGLFFPLSWFQEGDIFSYRLVHALLSIVLSVIIALRSRKVLDESSWFFFNSAYGLHPLVFGLARIARPYGLLLDLAALLIIEMKIFRETKRAVPLAVVAGVGALIHPFGLLSFLPEWIFANKEDRKRLFKIFFLAALPITLYYLLRGLLTPEPMSYINWIHSSPLTFLGELNALLLGSFFPFYQVLNPQITHIIFSVILVILGIGYYFKRPALDVVKFVFFYFFILIVFNLLSPLVDLRSSRYFVGLFPYFLFALASLVPRDKNLSTVLTGAIGCLLIIWVSILSPYFTHRHSLGGMISTAQEMAAPREAQILACGFTSHNWYFSRLGLKTCSSAKERQEIGQTPNEFLYMCMDNLLLPLVELSQNRYLVDFRGFDDGRILLFSAPGHKHEKRK